MKLLGGRGGGGFTNELKITTRENRAGNPLTKSESVSSNVLFLYLQSWKHLK